MDALGRVLGNFLPYPLAQAACVCEDKGMNTDTLRNEALAVASRLLTEKLSDFERRALTAQFETLNAELAARFNA